MFGVDHYGGFGRATRMIGRELAKRGIEVSAVVPRRSAEWPDQFELDGIRVFQVGPARPFEVVRLLRTLDADLFHSQEPSTLTALAQYARPDAPSLVTFRDPLNAAGWRAEIRNASHKLAVLLYAAYTDNPLVGRAVRRATRRYCAAEFVGELARSKFRLAVEPPFLPTPVEVPGAVEKAARPTVCFVGRWHPRKRPELFFELARQRPDVDFIAVGADLDPRRDQALRSAHGQLPNLDLPGAIDQFASNALGEIFSKSWILVNCSSREGLPTAFIEAAAHGCALLSCLDPDGLVSRFGCVAPTGELRQGLESLLEGDRWRALGRAARRFAGDEFSPPVAIDKHIQQYREVLCRQEAA